MGGGSLVSGRRASIPFGVGWLRVSLGCRGHGWPLLVRGGLRGRGADVPFNGDPGSWVMFVCACALRLRLACRVRRLGAGVLFLILS